MTASLRLHLLSKLEKDVQDFDFFKAERWTVEAEQQLLSKLQDLLATIHPYANGFEMNITVDVSDLKSAAFIINKKKKARPDVVINTQHLTLREIEVLGLIMQGMTNHEMADKLFVSYETIKSHRKNILHKTGARNTAALVSYYHQAFFDK